MQIELQLTKISSVGAGIFKCPWVAFRGVLCSAYGVN
jgi:hypothetical protein